MFYKFISSLKLFENAFFLKIFWIIFFETLVTEDKFSFLLYQFILNVNLACNVNCGSRFIILIVYEVMRKMIPHKVLPSNHLCSLGYFIYLV